jgi:hypothetical protein
LSRQHVTAKKLQTISYKCRRATSPHCCHTDCSSGRASRSTDAGQCRKATSNRKHSAGRSGCLSGGLRSLPRLNHDGSYLCY